MQGLLLKQWNFWGFALLLGDCVHILPLLGYFVFLIVQLEQTKLNFTSSTHSALSKMPDLYRSDAANTAEVSSFKCRKQGIRWKG